MNRGLPGKRVLCLMLAAMLLLSAAACGQGSVPDTTVPDPDPAPTEPVPAEPDLPEEPVPEPDPEPEPEPEPWTWHTDTPDLCFLPAAVGHDREKRPGGGHLLSGGV